MATDEDRRWMQRALALAARGAGTTSPNPLVGCVVVRDGEAVAEGWHERAGGPHAEVVALAAADGRARGAAVYVTLEPCAHTGRTGPCTRALLEAGVARVVAAVADPHPLARGGLDVLRAAGVDVELGVEGEAAARQNEVFLHVAASGRPFVTCKTAVSLDGRIAAADGTSQWLTSAPARQHAHALRAAADAVVVGSGTVLADDPQLTVRSEEFAGTQPLRVVLDRRGRTTGRTFRVDDEAAPTLRVRDSDDLDGLLRRLRAEHEVSSVLVEGGAEVLSAFLAAGLCDKLVVHVAPLLLGERGRPAVLGGPGTLADAGRFRLDGVQQVGDDALLTLYPEKGAG